jgi:RsiW-degrading membrane proteinase PrsW (M82 family)
LAIESEIEKRWRSRGVADAVLVAVTVAMGFSAAENLFYILKADASGGQ